MTITAKGELYRNYFQQLIDELREKHSFTNAKVGQPQNWYAFSAGASGVSYNATFVQGEKVRTELYIDFGDIEKNKALFNYLHDRKEEIQDKFGDELVWEPLEEKRASRISVYRNGSIEADPAELAEIKDWHVDILIKLKSSMAPFIKKGLKEIA